MIAALIAAVEEEPSQTLYFLAGGALALWAIGVSIVGFTRPDFPSSTMQSRAVIVTSIALTLFAMTAVILTS